MLGTNATILICTSAVSCKTPSSVGSQQQLNNCPDSFVPLGTVPLRRWLSTEMSQGQLLQTNMCGGGFYMTVFVYPAALMPAHLRTLAALVC
jgi:hypothetical protein